MFKGGIPEHERVTLPAAEDGARSIILRVNRAIGKERFNHYRPANWLAQQGVDAKFFAASTLDTFESVFKTINAIFGK
mgnify:CR=1 FL=1